ncbi:class I SAM-dependent methyltransferase [Natronobacterium gregoryi]|uniref:Class I SAM-dependent methyltransferase n=2 Tax=Natronobacterium gregoryi TaxID=44930 RepID=L0ALN0_NATGS|nr:class I SAM-dependent methyltransferase [Natronobacterium gregoryi]AFZ74686.1 methylase involved in ubiquinone/menaquinone biosynthesis [Natronobacterium gregoryi SP2]ELY73409.1 type 11 methyltransferase [Natronobacterium gregoryi SP2]PLK20931.1 class I SAM-dependent methyltransferase [Natronobacterium gregoryi SP2]SFJ04851.1 Methyltransferase domain-containing protein [Natronobacterium gregoryi]
MTNESVATGHDHDAEIDHPVFAAVYDLLPQSLFPRVHREYLARDLAGRVLEIGTGNGAMFPYVVEAASDGLEYHAIEPDPNMRPRAKRQARASGLAVDLRDARAESLPYPDDAFDVVLSGMVFCTVQDPDAALAEVARVLKPDGEFRFLEHVGADGWRRAGQELLNPLWERAGGGCQLNRDTVDRFASHDSFALEEIERLEFGIFPVTPFVRGTLRRRRERPV